MSDFLIGFVNFFVDARALAIRDIYRAGGVPMRELARQHGVTKQTISRVVRGELWAM